MRSCHYRRFAAKNKILPAAAAAAQFRIAQVCKIIVSYLHKAQYKICKIFTSTIFSVT
jgi:hypothetical protein